MADALADNRMTSRVAIKRALEAAGFVFLRGGWVRKEAAPRLQDKINAAVRDAAELVERIKNVGTHESHVGTQEK